MSSVGISTTKLTHVQLGLLREPEVLKLERQLHQNLQSATCRCSGDKDFRSKGKPRVRKLYSYKIVQLLGIRAEEAQCRARLRCHDRTESQTEQRMNKKLSES
jgi:hypothetical protein